MVRGKNIPLDERIIFALDVDSHEAAQKWVERLEDHVRFYKVGLQLFLAGWFRTVDWIVQRGHKVMVDLKFFDIPETVSHAVRQLKDRGVTFATVHGNDPIIEGAVKEKDGLKILAVTALTCFGEEDMIEMFGQPVDIEELVLSRARRALRIGADGVVSSGLETRRLRDDLGGRFLIVTPGIRPGKNREIPMDDQKRIITAGEAVANGADHVVVGRPIRTSPDPLAVVRQMQAEILRAMETRK
ncbi:MAG: orotidine-5'-phosphate decarboxylase [Syntrophobacteraceae bacterium]|nr:orotidine-5'-phosphate decarboxylase [Syntrophobacteraceae bacterium]